jgi:tRNA pseudouridine38-40 synthase
MRYFFEISYKGTNYSGWQSQLNATGIQTVVEECLRKMLREDIAIVASGRTDAGVHCMQQFFHADIQQELSEKDFLHNLNSFLPKDIAVHAVLPVISEASARYDAFERSYIYKIVRKRNVFTPGFAWYFFKPLDISNMNEAAALLVGRHDFRCFSKVHTDVVNFVCDVKEAVWKEDGDNLTFCITANRFLRGMVRAIVGTLVDVGQGRTSIGKFREILNSGDRREAGANVPPEGLYLVGVRYPEHIFLTIDREV